VRTISLTCSPDADDLFMMRALFEGLLDTGDYRFDISTSPTDALNRLASGDAGPDVLALSVAHFPRVADRYQLLPHGGSLGEGYGPVVVAREPMSLGDLAGLRVGVPGLSTTACTVLRMMVDVEAVVTPISPYSLIFDALRDGSIDAGLIIHEGRLTFEDEGFVKVVDIGEWWAEQNDGLPLPLGANAIRRDLGETVIAEVSALLRESIVLGLRDRDEAIEWLLAKGGPLGTAERVGRYLDMYANARTLDYGPDGVRGVEVLLERAADAGLLPRVSPELLIMSA
jgi:1,4-dihydroxy-6-naphthoate synthase